MIDRLGFKSETDVRTRAICLSVIVIPPVLLAYSCLVGFVNAIFSAGTFGGIIMSILPVFMLRRARKHGDKLPCWKCGWIAHPVVQALVVVLFAGAGVYAILSIFGWLPAAW